MLYLLFQYLESFDFPGAGVFQYITFRSACAIILSLIIATVVGKRVIRMLQRQQLKNLRLPQLSKPCLQQTLLQQEFE